MKTFLTIFFSLAWTAQAIADSHDGDDFCATAPAELMTALDGTWTLTQGRGFALGGGGVGTPLPAHPPQPMQLAFNPDLGIGVLSAQGQNMIMLPANARATAEHIDSLILDTGVENVRPEDGPCDWYALPSLIGTNVYALQGDGQRAFDATDIVGIVQHDVFLVGEVNFIVVCAGTFTEEILSDMAAGRTPGEGPAINVVGDPDCERPQAGQGEMDMTVFLRFTSTDAASGLLSFRGNMRAGGQNIVFTAQAPISMTR